MSRVPRGGDSHSLHNFRTSLGPLWICSPQHSYEEGDRWQLSKFPKASWVTSSEPHRNNVHPSKCFKIFFWKVLGPFRTRSSKRGWYALKIQRITQGANIPMKSRKQKHLYELTSWPGPLFEIFLNCSFWTNYRFIVDFKEMHGVMPSIPYSHPTCLNVNRAYLRVSSYECTRLCI